MTSLPQTPGHLSDVPTELMIEQYGGAVESQFHKSVNMREFVPIRPVLGTDTITNNRVGRTALQALVPGVRPPATPTQFGRVSLTVDTVIIARDNRSMLNEFQTHFDARVELGKDHGKEIAKFFDQAFLIQAIKGAGQAAPANLNGAIGAGKSITLAAPGDETDADALYAAIASIITQMEDEDADVSELVIFVSPATFEVLMQSDKLLSRDFADGNGDYAKGTLYSLKGARIVKTTRIPDAVITGHMLSNANNGNAYDINATEARTVAVVMHPKSLFAGETIPMSSAVYFSDVEKQWFIDSWIAFAVTVNRPDVCGRVLKA